MMAIVMAVVLGGVLPFSATEVGIGESVTIATRVANSGDTAGSYAVTIDGRSQTFTVESSASQAAAPEAAKEINWWLGRRG